jgi:hypothetical protein
MDHPTPQPATFRTGPLTGQVVAAAVLGSFLGLGVAYAAGWAGGDLQALAIASLVAMLVWVGASILGVLLLSVNTQHQLSRIAPGVLASSTTRMLVALAVGVLLFFVLSLEGRTFWTSFLLAGLLALVAETAWAMRTINAPRRRGAGVS